MKAITYLLITQHILAMWGRRPGIGGDRRRWSPFDGARLCAYRPSPWYQFARLLSFIVSTIVYSRLVGIVLTGFLYAPYGGLPSINDIFMHASFFSNFLHGLAGACMGPRGVCVRPEG